MSKALERVAQCGTFRSTTKGTLEWSWVLGRECRIMSRCEFVMKFAPTQRVTIFIASPRLSKLRPNSYQVHRYALPLLLHLSDVECLPATHSWSFSPLCTLSFVDLVRSQLIFHCGACKPAANLLDHSLQALGVSITRLS